LTGLIWFQKRTHGTVRPCRRQKGSKPHKQK
jgi:hypothetical protein